MYDKNEFDTSNFQFFEESYFSLLTYVNLFLNISNSYKDRDNNDNKG